MAKISVVMTVHNGERFLREAVDSILDQTYRDFEFLIIDDGSTDATPDILAAYRDPRLRVVTAQRGGRVKSLNRGVGTSREEYVAIMDADDISMPRRLELQTTWLNDHPRTAVLGTGTLEIDENGRAIGQHYNPTDALTIEQSLLRGVMCPCHSSAMFRKTCFDAVGGYRDGFLRAEDYDLWLRMAERYDIESLPEILFQRRLYLRARSLEQYLREKRNAAFALECALRRRRGLDKPSIPPPDTPPTRRELAEYHCSLGRASLDLGRLDDARAEFRRSLVSYPFDPYIWYSYLGSLAGRSFLRRSFPVARRIVRLLPWLRKERLGPFRR